MAKRFGRNQRRKMREEIADTERALAFEVASRFREKQAHERQLKEADATLLLEMQQGRMTRNCIKLDLDTIFDPMEQRLQHRARVEDLTRRDEPLYAAIDMRDLERKSEHERMAWAKLAAEQIADHLLQAMLRHYRTR